MIDWDRIQELKEEVGEEELAEVLPIFFEEVSETISALPESDTDTLRKNLHFLKGSAANIGMAELSRVCAKLEGTIATSTKLDLAHISAVFECSRLALIKANL